MEPLALATSRLVTSQATRSGCRRRIRAAARAPTGAQVGVAMSSMVPCVTGSSVRPEVPARTDLTGSTVVPKPRRGTHVRCRHSVLRSGAALRRRVRRSLQRVAARRTRIALNSEAGMSTAEYAVGTVAACGFAALLWTILHSSAVQDALSGLLTKALSQI